MTVSEGAREKQTFVSFWRCVQAHVQLKHTSSQRSVWRRCFIQQGVSHASILPTSLCDLWFKSLGTVTVPCFCLFGDQVWSHGLDRISPVSRWPRWRFVIGRRLCEQTLYLISKKEKKLDPNSVFLSTFRQSSSADWGFLRCLFQRLYRGRH